MSTGFGHSLPIAVVFIDLDGFKEVNDAAGHSTGDEVLREGGRRLRSAVRAKDLVVRYGGDEFVVICEDSSALEVDLVAERIRRAIEVPFAFLAESMTVTASIGVAAGVPRGGVLPIERLIRAADHAMYSAKAEGGNQVVTGHL